MRQVPFFHKAIANAVELDGVVRHDGAQASRSELISLFAGIADGGGGLFEILDDFADFGVELGWIGQMCTAFKVPVTIAFPGAAPGV